MKSSVKNLPNNPSKKITEFGTKRENKKSININWNSRLFFQIGIIVCISLSYIVLKSNLGFTKNVKDVAINDLLDEIPMGNFVIDEPVEIINEKFLEKQTNQNNKIITDKIDVITNSANAKESKNIAVTKITPRLNNNTYTKNIKKLNNKVSKTMKSVEFVPVFPGCEIFGTKKEKTACMSSKIGAFINKKFRTDRFSDLESNKIQRIYVKFKIDTRGNVTDVVANANDRSLEKEAKRVISLLPKMQPGKQGNTNVNVIYMVPIVFKIEK